MYMYMYVYIYDIYIYTFVNSGVYAWMWDFQRIVENSNFLLDSSSYVMAKPMATKFDKFTTVEKWKFQSGKISSAIR